MRRTSHYFLFGLTVALTFSCAGNKPSGLVADNFEFAEKQINYAFEEIGIAKANESEQSRMKRTSKNWGDLTNPRNIEPDGSLHLVPSRDWTSGFFPGELWYLYEYTGAEQWKVKADRQTRMIEREKLNGGTHDMGFKVYCSFGNGYRLTQDSAYRQVLIDAAYTVISRFKPAVGCIRSWDHNADKWQCPVIIDNMMNLEHLFWAFRETGDSVFYQIPVSHARTTMKNHFRSDYSCYHVVDYDTLSGEVLKKNTHQGLAHESAWARGQAWAIYGYTMCYRETGLPEFLEQAKRIHKYLFSHPHLPADLIPYWDFDAPGIPSEPRDASAAAVIASALYELSLYDEEIGATYKEQADLIVTNLASAAFRSPLGENKGFLLLHSTGSKPHNSEIDVPIVYADYYFLEALLRKKKLEETNKLF